MLISKVVKIYMKQNKVKVVGLTGGIASGKSTVSNYLKTKNFIVVDCDKIARSITDKDDVLDILKSEFGSEIILENGKLDRKKLKNIVFNDKSKKKTLDTLLQKPLRTSILKYLELAIFSTDRDLVFLDCPLLFESGLDKNVDINLVIDISKDLQLKRLLNRDNLDYFMAKKIIDSQMSTEEKIKKADYVLDNNKDTTNLLSQVDEFIYKFTKR